MSDGFEPQPGTVVAQRFAIDRLAGSGGMGSVFRALDQVTSEWVALKVMHRLSGADRDEKRFLREAHVLAELRHPGIVGYIAHGHTEHGVPYLAMQWLEGEDLGQTLLSRGLRLSESLTLVRQIPAALTMAHRRGIVHRDLKPSNLFLSGLAGGGQLERVMLLDFGVARRTLGRTLSHRSGRMTVTQTGMVVGTPEYMAPEQARGQSDIGPAADVFSLGCVLFECLTGQPPFVGEHIAAVLAKILFDEAPLLRSLRPELPESLEAMLARMLDKNPANRLRDAEAVLELLEELGPLAEANPPDSRHVPVTESMQGGEQQLFSVLYAAEPGELAEEVTLAPTQDRVRQAMFQSLRTSLLVHGVRAERLADGSLVATVTTSQAQSAATDQAALAARGALLIHEQWPLAKVAIATGRGVLRAELPVGEAIDRAVRLLRAPRTAASSQILLDTVTAGLLDSRFELAPLEPGCFALLGEHTSLDMTRPLLGKPTPCVGREQELAMLQAALAGCIDDSSARAVLIVGQSGLGKSRLRHEFLRMQEQQNGVTILYGRADPTYTSSPYAMLGQALQRHLGLSGRRSPAEQWARLREQVAERLGPDPLSGQAARVAEFLGEIVNLPPAEQPSPLFRGARAEPARMAELVSAALADYLKAECAVRPVLLVLEDLQWADAPSVRLSEAVLRALSEHPLLVIGLSRPEVEERFPRLWLERGRQEIRLPPLSRRASERLVLRVLGPKVAPATVARIVEQAAGNALFLEELIRAAAEGKGEELPETVLAMLQARIGRLDTVVRRVMRAASVFGDTFSAAGVRALLGHETNTLAVQSCLRVLVDAEIIEAGRHDANPEERAYTFRHSLLREAAYGLLTDTDRRLGHHLAAGYLETQSLPDPQVIADHLERAGERERACGFFLSAGHLALLRSDVQTADASCARAEACGASGPALGSLHTLRGEIGLLRGELANAIRESRSALTLLPAGSEPWCRAVAIHVASAGMSGHFDYLATVVEDFGRVTPQPEARGVFVFASSLIAQIYAYLGMREAALETLGRAEALAGEVLEQNPFAETSYFRALAAVYQYLGTDPWLIRQTLAHALAAAEKLQHPRSIISDGMNLALHDAQLGNHAEAEARQRELHRRAYKLDEPFLRQTADTILLAVLISSGQPDKIEEARGMALALQPQLTDNLVMRGLLYSLLGQVFLLLGQPDRAIVELRQATELFIVMPGLRSLPLTFLLQALVKKGDVAEALRVAAETTDLLAMIGRAGWLEPIIHLSIAEAQMLAGDRVAALATLTTARRYLLAGAASLPAAAARDRYLHDAGWHARVLKLSQEWLDAPAPSAA